MILIKYLALALVWGASFLFIKVSLEGLSPAQVVLGRVGLGAIALVVIMAVTRRKWPRNRSFWLHQVVISILMCVAPFLLYSWAGQYIPSGLSSIYNATTPLMTMLVALVVLPSERLNAARTVGIVLGALGIVIVAAPWTFINDPSLATSLPAQLACLGATACYGLGGVYMRRFMAGTHDSVTVAGGQVGMATVVMLILAPFIGGFEPVTLTLPVVLSIVALGVLGTGVAYIWYTSIIVTWGATLSSTVTYLTPLVGVTLGILILGEQISWNEPVGALLVIVGILASQGRLRFGRRPALPAADSLKPNVGGSD